MRGVYVATHALGEIKAMEAIEEWCWEGNVVAVIAEHLRSTGWEVVRVPDTATRERGPDIEASRSGITLLVEVKGYPSVGYRNPALAGLKKKTNPATQARHWYAQALLQAIRYQAKYPGALVAMGFPMAATYASLFEQTQGAMGKLGLGFFWVMPDGMVEGVGLR